MIEICTELTLDQVLQKGIEAHQAGKAWDAGRYCTAPLHKQKRLPYRLLYYKHLRL